MKLSSTVLAAMLLAAPFSPGARAQDATEAPARAAVEDFFAATSLDEREAGPARERLAAAWQDGDAALIVDLLDLMRRTSMVNPMSWVRLSRLGAFLGEQTGQPFGVDVAQWQRWLWSRPYEPHPDYGTFKALLYGQLDERFEEFFRQPLKTAIRLDEIQWGGVAVNGIPPLDHPTVLAAAEADYLDDGNIVFGISVNGESRAYPKRILAWHEMALDTIGGDELTVVYCTLCGTVIPYESRVGGRLRVFGTSGFLYQSNKLMFDRETKTLWSSLDGTPAIGPLVGSGLRLAMRPVVTTTWGEWRALHPETTVLSLDTGYARDYSEGAAYATYFATDGLMFPVTRFDGRLKNKAEVLALRLAPPDGGDPVRSVAVSAAYLAERPVYHLDVEGTDLVVVTSAEGANRVYEAGGHRFERLDGQGRAIDDAGRAWVVEEDQLRATFDDAARLPRVPAHRAFWFGWYAQYPDTILIPR